MRLAPFVSEEDVDESLRLFKVSTMSAALTGDVETGDDGQDHATMDQLLQIEQKIKQRFPIGHRVSEERILADLVQNRGFNEGSVRKVLHIMVRRGQLEHHMQRRLLVRVK